MGDAFVTKEAPRGDVRAFDVRTGALRWRFHTIPQAGELGTDTWEEDSWEYTGHAPVWTLFSADEELGYVYLPVSSSTNDMYGGHRPGGNLFSQSLVCVDAETGERVWHFQLVHHGLWDYDPPAAPILMDITVDGREIKAVTQLTKQAFAYVFDRVTGEPVWPIHERPVPPSETPGEWTSPTQPFPTKPPAFDRQGATVDNLIDFTPELRQEALEIVSRYTMGPLFTPPVIVSDDPNGSRGTIQLPGSQGGANVQGAAFDPETGYLFIPSITAPFVADILEGNPEHTNLRYVAGRRMWIVGPRGLPLFKPPYGRITAIDMNRGEIVWQVANRRRVVDHECRRLLESLEHSTEAGMVEEEALHLVDEHEVEVIDSQRHDEPLLIVVEHPLKLATLEVFPVDEIHLETTGLKGSRELEAVFLVDAEIDGEVVARRRGRFFGKGHQDRAHVSSVFPRRGRRTHGKGEATRQERESAAACSTLGAVQIIPPLLCGR